MTATAIRHGTTSSYTKGCRCEECRFAMASYGREYRARKVNEPRRLAASAIKGGRGCDDGCQVDAWDYEHFRSLACVVCGVSPANGVDHIIPYARGGHNVVENLQPMCPDDNRLKGPRLMVEFVGWESDYGDY